MADGSIRIILYMLVHVLSISSFSWMKNLILTLLAQAGKKRKVYGYHSGEFSNTLLVVFGAERGLPVLWDGTSPYLATTKNRGNFPYLALFHLILH